MAEPFEDLTIGVESGDVPQNTLCALLHRKVAEILVSELVEEAWIRGARVTVVAAYELPGAWANPIAGLVSADALNPSELIEDEVAGWARRPEAIATIWAPGSGNFLGLWRTLVREGTFSDAVVGVRRKRRGPPRIADRLISLADESGLATRLTAV